MVLSFQSWLLEAKRPVAYDNKVDSWLKSVDDLKRDMEELEKVSDEKKKEKPTEEEKEEKPKKSKEEKSDDEKPDLKPKDEKEPEQEIDKKVLGNKNIDNKKPLKSLANFRKERIKTTPVKKAVVSPPERFKPRQP